MEKDKTILGKLGNDSDGLESTQFLLVSNAFKSFVEKRFKKDFAEKISFSVEYNFDNKAFAINTFPFDKFYRPNKTFAKYIESEKGLEEISGFMEKNNVCFVDYF